MIIPGKHLRQDRALLSIGGEILAQLDEPRTISELWERVHVVRNGIPTFSPLSFDWFILSLNLLYAISAIDLVNGIISLRES